MKWYSKKLIYTDKKIKHLNKKSENGDPNLVNLLSNLLKKFYFKNYLIY